MTFRFPEKTILRWSCQDSSKCFAVHNPSTGKPITEVYAGNESTVDQAVLYSQTAFEQWRRLTPAERSNYLLRCADKLQAHTDELATLLSTENGKPLRDARAGDISFLIDVFRYFGSLVDKLPSQFYDRGPMYCTVIQEPYGVCCGILPFNWPPVHAGGKAAPALAAGNTVILKPGEQAPLTVIKIVELLEDVLPPGVLQVVPGLGPEVPQALISHPLVKVVSFTGSTQAGMAVARTAAASLTKVMLELGGKNAMIVFDDADLDRAVRDALAGAFFNKGEACTATSRLLVQRGVYQEFITRLGRAVSRLRVGDALDSSTHIGPQVTRVQQQRLLDYLELGREEGARVFAQADIDAVNSDGFFVPLTLLTDVTEDMRVAQEEIFGPIVTAMPFAEFDEAVRIVNASPYGLRAAIYTQDAKKASRMARLLDVGMVYINNYNRGVLGTPFGGTKHSGYSREHCIETLLEWSTPKAIHTESGLGDVPEWHVVDDVFGCE